MRYEPNSILVKICGLTDEPNLNCALECGADLIGLVFYSRSPRNVTFAHAKVLCALAGAKKTVALTVDAEDDFLDRMMDQVAPQHLQLHGGETVARAQQLKSRYGVSILRALGVGCEEDLIAAQIWDEVADMLIFDAKPPKDAARPGGNGRQFDWRLMQAWRGRKPWLLSGGLDAGNVAQALEIARAPGVDASSGLESAPGVKDKRKIAQFLTAARAYSEKVGDFFDQNTR